MVCPISGDVMRDPVTVVQSGLTYDRKSLCTSLLLYPDLEPGTGQRFDHPLHYTPNVVVRKMIMAQHGDSYYEKHDDEEFKVQYEAKWKETADATVGDIKEHDSGGDSHWSSFEAESGFAVPASATATHTDWGAGDHNDLFDSFSFDGVAENTSANASNGGGFERESTKSEAGIPGVKYGDSEDTDRVDTMSSDTDDGAEKAATHAIDMLRAYWRSRRARWLVAGTAGRVDPFTTVTDSEGEAAKPSFFSHMGDTLRACWRSRRARWLIAGAVLVVLIVIVGVAVRASKSRPASPSSSSETPNAASRPTSSPTMTPVEKFTSTLPPYSAESLQDTSSPQYRAYNWVTQSDKVPESDEDTRLFRMTQRFALATMLYSLGLDSWVGSNVSECNWGRGAGGNVTCNDESVILALDTNGAGEDPSRVPREVGLLTDLERLDLYGCYLTSSIPTELGLLAALTELDLGANDLSSSIPTELGLLANLTELDLSDNELTSSIPTELGLLDALTTLDIYYNSLTSSIPTELGLLTNLAILVLDYNSLNSSIPTELGWLTELTFLDLDSNSLTSSIPTELGRLAALTYLDLDRNSLTSSIPTELGQLDALTAFSLRTNSLNSSIPTELGLLAALTYLDLCSNSLTSSIPTELGKLVALHTLYLQNNSLTSSIPTELGRLSNLDYLGVHDTLLTGTLPSALCSVNGIDNVCSEVACNCT